MVPAEVYDFLITLSVATTVLTSPIWLPVFISVSLKLAHYIFSFFSR